MALSGEEMESLLAPYLAGLPPVVAPPPGLVAGLQAYLDLLLRWNARTNLTAIRNEREIVERHFGESLFAGVCLVRQAGTAPGTVLDLGSGAGFPGIPLQLLLPQARVVLAESQGKKAAFLREVVRSLGLQTEVWAARAETLERQFAVVTMRAVDRMGTMRDVARSLVRTEGWLLELTTEVSEGQGCSAVPGRRSSFVCVERCP